MTVSVVIPLYNKAPYIKRALDSVLAQTYTDFECIVVDDGSTDGSGDVVRRYTDPRIRLIVQENAGVSAARNRGVSEARTELIAFLDADDEWRPHFLETLFNLWKKYPTAGAFAAAYEIQRDGELQRPFFNTRIEPSQDGLIPDYFLAACSAPPVCSSAVMVPKRVFGVVGGFPVGVKLNEDGHMWAQIALRYPIAWSSRASAIYHMEADNRTCVIVPIYLDPPMAAPIEAFLASGEKPLMSSKSILEHLAFCRLELAKSLCATGRTRESWNLLKKTAGTKRYRKQRLVLQCALLMPRCLFAPVRKIRRFWLTLLGVS